MATVKDLMVKLKADTSDFDRGMDEASNSASNFSNKMGKVMDNVKSFLIYDIGKNLVTGFVNATKAGIDYNATLEQSKVAWKALVGNEKEAEKVMASIRDIAKTTPFGFEGLDKLAKNLEMAGLGGKDLEKNLIAVGDAVAGVGGGQEAIDGVSRALIQMSMKGIVSAEEMQQLAEHGIPSFELLADSINITTGELMEMMKEGQVMSKDVLPLLFNQMDKAFGGSMQSQSETFNGKLETLKDTFKETASIMTQNIFEKLTTYMTPVIDLLEKLGDSFGKGGLSGIIEDFAPQIAPFVDSAIGVFDNLKNAVKRILDAIMGFWNEHSSWLMPLISFTWDFICNFIGTTINAIASVIEAGLSVIDGIINFFQNLFSGNFEGCWESIKQIFSNAIKLIWNWMQVQFAVNLPNMIKNFAKSIPNMVSGMWNSIKSFFSNGITNCIQFVKNLFTNASSNFGMLKTFGANTFEALWSIAKNAMSNLLKAVISNIKQVPTNIKNFMTQAVNVIKNINLFSIGKSMIQGLINGIKNMGSSVVGAIGGVVTSAIDSAKKKLGINSPSRVFRKIGEGTGQGLVNGLENKEIDVKKASQNLSSSVIGGYNARINTNFTKGNSKANNQNISSNQDSPIIVNTILDGKTIAQTIASYSDVVSGNRMNLAERGLAL